MSSGFTLLFRRHLGVPYATQMIDGHQPTSEEEGRRESGGRGGDGQSASECSSGEAIKSLAEVVTDEQIGLSRTCVSYRIGSLAQKHLLAL